MGPGLLLDAYLQCQRLKGPTHREDTHTLMSTLWVLLESQSALNAQPLELNGTMPTEDESQEGQPYQTQVLAQCTSRLPAWLRDNLSIHRESPLTDTEHWIG